jgi:hypothetical protein
VSSKTTALDCRARAGGEINGLAEANKAVLAIPREEAAEEHGGDVLGWWPQAEMGGVGPWRRYFGVVEGLHHADSEPSGQDLAAAHQPRCVRWLLEGELR